MIGPPVFGIETPLYPSLGRIQGRTGMQRPSESGALRCSDSVATVDQRPLRATSAALSGSHEGFRGPRHRLDEDAAFSGETRLKRLTLPSGGDAEMASPGHPHNPQLSPSGESSGGPFRGDTRTTRNC